MLSAFLVSNRARKENLITGTSHSVGIPKNGSLLNIESALFEYFIICIY